MRRETTAEWIDEQVTAILHAHPKDEVDRCIPVLVLLMARDFGFENLRPDMRDAVCRIATKIGLVEGMDVDEAKSKTVVYVHNLKVNPEILTEIKQVFDTHYAARAEVSAQGFRKVLHTRRVLAPSVREQRAPRTDDQIMSAELLRKATGMIRS